MEVTLRLRGTRALLIHNVQLASPLNKYAKRLAALNRERPSSQRTDEDRLLIAHTEWCGGWYMDEQLGPYVPASWAFRVLLDGARASNKQGKKVEAGLQTAELMMPLKYDGPRDLVGLWGNDGDSPFVDFRSVRVGTAKVDRCRPILREWEVDVPLILDSSELGRDLLVEFARKAGSKGMGDYRQQFGRFEVLGIS